MEKNKKDTSAVDVDKSKKAIRIAISVLIALVFWFYVDEVKEVNVTTTVHDIPVEFSGEDTALADNGLMLLSGYDTTIDLKLQGPRKVLWKLDKDEIRIVADTSGIVDTGVQSLTYQVVYPDNVQRSQLQVEWASVYSITVTVGELYTKEIPISCDVIGEVANGYIAEELILDPTMLVLRAQRDDLLNVSYAKIELDISGATETVIRTMEFQLYDYNDVPIENDNIRAVTKLIQATVPVKTVKDVPLLINFVEAVGSTEDQIQYEIDPEKIRLKGEYDALADIDSIVLDTVYLQDLEEYQELTYDIPVPEGTELIGEAKKVTVTITLTGVQEKKVGVSHFSAENLPEGYEAAFVTEHLEITLRGLTEEIRAITGNDLVITADLQSINGQGTHTVPVKIEVVGYENVGIKGSYQVVVSVMPISPEEPEGRTMPDAADAAGVSAASETEELIPAADEDAAQQT